MHACTDTQDTALPLPLQILKDEDAPVRGNPEGNQRVVPSTVCVFGSFYGNQIVFAELHSGNSRVSLRRLSVRRLAANNISAAPCRGAGGACEVRRLRSARRGGRARGVPGAEKRDGVRVAPGRVLSWSDYIIRNFLQFLTTAGAASPPLGVVSKVVTLSR